MFFQLDLPRGVVKKGSFIDLKSHGGLCAPTSKTLLHVVKCDRAFNSIHGEGATLANLSDVMVKTENFIKNQFSEVPGDIIKLFTKIKYYARIRAINELHILERSSELKRKAEARKEAPKKLKTMREYKKVFLFQESKAHI